MWIPEQLDPTIPRYQAIAGQLAEAIRAGRLQAGERLPVVRELAQILGVTVGTVHRAYALAERRGLLERRVGRGSFVSKALAPAPSAGPVDLSLNRPAPVPMGRGLWQPLTELAADCEPASLLDYGPSQGLVRHRRVLAAWIGGRGLAVDPERLILSNGAQQALMIALGALTRPGDTVLVEALTYPGIHSLAGLYGLRLRPVAMDREGLCPRALDTALRDSDSRLLFCMPWAHNPTTATQGGERREALAALVRQHQLPLVEADVYDHGDVVLPALSALCPEQGLYLGSLSKMVAPGLRLGFLHAPPRLHERLLAVTQATALMVSPLLAELACRWLAGGLAAELACRRREAAAGLQRLAAESLAGFGPVADPHNTHLWLPLPEHWNAEDFARRLQAEGVLVTPGERFAVERPPCPAVRLCLGGADSREALARGLGTVAELARERPGPGVFRL